eukprot:TRINITY_DN1280_c0_g1_i10.p1 TRINITY_DN1280_c0_g1~~TRINITY_DN1280_c0_g1_i10.p1  ORF type:complete len:117 (+),score=5.90 TRINITY_DN1280_c0_g1_i10:299-649(+)
MEFEVLVSENDSDPSICFINSTVRDNCLSLRDVVMVSKKAKFDSFGGTVLPENTSKQKTLQLLRVDAILPKTKIVLSPSALKNVGVKNGERVVIRAVQIPIGSYFYFSSGSRVIEN